MTLHFPFGLAVPSAAAGSPPLSMLVLLLLFVIVSGPLLMPIFGRAAHLVWRLCVRGGRVLVRYAVEKVIDAIVWGAVGLIGALLLWG